MSQGVDSILFKDLAAMDPMAVCARTDCDYDGESGQYLLEVWGGRLGIQPREKSVVVLEPSALPSGDYLTLLALHYLMKSSFRDPMERWISEKDIPGGAAFFRGPHAIPTQRITDAHGDDLDGFRARCGQLGGTPLDMADAAFAFEVLPRIPVAALYWVGDEDFPCQARLLFDKGIGHHLPLDIIFALAVLVCRTLGRAE
ncbi:MAG: DUF3786 domain-containing protein [Desulfobacterales bacterium]|nr:DUF3786 domain-containing protein [Desulfobacterales bacterium]